MQSRGVSIHLSVVPQSLSKNLIRMNQPNPALPTTFTYYHPPLDFHFLVYF